MKKQLIVGMALIMGMLAAGAVSASAAGSCCNDGSCADKQVVRQFTEESASLSSDLKAIESELREQYGYDAINIRKVNDLEAERKELRGRISVVAGKHGIKTCCLG